MPEPRLELDAVLKCPHCGGVPYKVFRRQNRLADGSLAVSFSHVLWPSDPGVAPPVDPHKVCCPECGDELKRGAP